MTAASEQIASFSDIDVALAMTHRVGVVAQIILGIEDGRSPAERREFADWLEAPALEAAARLCGRKQTDDALIADASAAHAAAAFERKLADTGARREDVILAAIDLVLARHPKRGSR